jgi:hypothetical protein
MGVKSYSLKADGNKPLSANFKVWEFAQKDGREDTILIDDRLVRVLQIIRDSFNKPVRINSAYRTAAYNRQIGGATNSQHIQGTAADIAINGVAPLQICQAAERALTQVGVTVGGIGQYAGFTHVDVRAANRWRCNMVTGVNLTAFVGDDGNRPATGGSPTAPTTTRATIRNGSRGDDVRALQGLINSELSVRLKVDGIFGNQTEAEVKGFQQSRGLVADGIVGPRTWGALGL